MWFSIKLIGPTKRLLGNIFDCLTAVRMEPITQQYMLFGVKKDRFFGRKLRHKNDPFDTHTKVEIFVTNIIKYITMENFK